MFAIAKAVLLALAVTGLAATGVVAGVTHVPLQKAIDIHKEHLGQNSTMPIQSRQGQQNAIDHLMENHERWMAKPHNETGDDDLDDTDEEELSEIGDAGFSHAFERPLHWMKMAF